MKIQAIRTDKITPTGQTIFEVLDKAITELPEKSVVAISSKIVALCEGRISDKESVTKEQLVAEEASHYLPAVNSKYGITLSIARNTLIASAGIDESNTGGHYVLWPEDSQRSANEIREYVSKKFNITEVGVVITDSTCTPFRWGTTGIVLAHSGFAALHNYVGEPDVFGRPLAVTRSNIAQGLSAAAVLVMGEGNEQTPITTITDLPFVEFQPRNPTVQELNGMKITPVDDLYAPLINSVDWEKGQG